MRQIRQLTFILIVAFSCSSSEDPADLDGTWEAQWKADPLSFQDMSPRTKYTMNGEFVFDGENLTVKAEGYPGCLFGEDTISHTQQWKISRDTLHLISEPGITGISYRILSQSRDTMELQLLDDISITLRKVEAI